jgi:hypothetical protein
LLAQLVKECERTEIQRLRSSEIEEMDDQRDSGRDQAEQDGWIQETH